MAKSKFRPLHDRVVVKRIDAEEKTKGGIIIPDSAKEKPSQGEITAVGPGGRDEAGKLIPIDLKVGVRQMVGHRDQTRRRRTPDHEGERHHGRAELTHALPHPEEAAKLPSRRALRFTSSPFETRPRAAPQGEDHFQE